MDGSITTAGFMRRGANAGGGGNDQRNNNRRGGMGAGYPPPQPPNQWAYDHPPPPPSMMPPFDRRVGPPGQVYPVGGCFINQLLKLSANNLYNLFSFSHMAAVVVTVVVVTIPLLLLLLSPLPLIHKWETGSVVEAAPSLEAAPTDVVVAVVIKADE